MWNIDRAWGKGVKKIKLKKDKETGLLVEPSTPWGSNIISDDNNDDSNNIKNNNKFDCLCLSSFFLFPSFRYKSFIFLFCQNAFILESDKNKSEKKLLRLSRNEMIFLDYERHLPKGRKQKRGRKKLAIEVKTASWQIYKRNKRN